MKKQVIFVLALLFVVAGAASALAGPANVVNVNQKGSVLFFPKIDITKADSGPWRDTFVTISNDQTAPVNVKCYWVNGVSQDLQDFEFTLTPNQPFAFSACNGYSDSDKTGDVAGFSPLGPVGFLVCFAVDAAFQNPINWNHLYGTATIVDSYYGTAYAYNSFNFDVRAAGVLPGANVPLANPGVIPFDGVTFDACPQYLLFNFPAAGALDWKFYNNDLTIVSCKQDLRQDHNITKTKLLFTIWDENEMAFTNIWQCVNCWFEDELTHVAHGGSRFSAYQLHTDFGRFRVEGKKSTQCPVGNDASSLLGLMVEEINTGYKDSEPTWRFDATASVVSVGAGTSAGTAGQGFVKFDPNGDVVEMPGKK